MICPKCQLEGLTSRVVMGLSSSTLVHHPGYHDEEGVYHLHDRNSRRTRWRCTNGHTGTKHHQNRCPAPECGWTSGSDEVWFDTPHPPTPPEAA
jgi:hypothetical protein